MTDKTPPRPQSKQELTDRCEIIRKVCRQLMAEDGSDPEVNAIFEETLSYPDEVVYEAFVLVVDEQLNSNAFARKLFNGVAEEVERRKQEGAGHA